MKIKLSDHFTYSKLLRFVFPSIIMMVFTSIYGVVDGLFVSNFAGKTAFASINLVMPFVMILGGIGFMIGTGGTALVSKVLGEGKKEKANEIFTMMIIFTLLLGTLLSVIGVVSMPWVAKFLGATEEMMADCVLYGRIVTGFTVAFMLQNVFQSFLIAAEKPKLGLLATVLAGIANMALDAIFIIVFKWVVAGAAIATVLSRYVEAAIVIGWTHRHTEKNAFAKGLYSTLKVPANLTKKILVKGTPLLFNETLWASAMAMLTQCYSIRGLNVVASLNISNTINNVFNIVFIALGDSVAIIVGQLLGAGDMKKARDTDNKMIAFSVMCCTCVAMVMFVMAPLFPMLYNTNDEARELAKYLIMITAFFMPQNAFLHATYFTLRSGGKTIITFLFDSVFIWCVSVPIAFVLSRYTGIHVLVIYACVQLADLIKCVIGFVLVKKGVWLQNIVSS